VPGAAAFSVITTVAAAPAASESAKQSMLTCERVHARFVAVSPVIVARSNSALALSAAASGPLLRTVIVYVWLVPTVTGAVGPPDSSSAKSATGRTVTLASACALAQAPSKPDASPRFEIRRFVFEGAALVPSEQLEAATQGFTGPGRTFSDVQRALEAVERTYSEAGFSAVQVVLPEQELERGEIRFQIVEAKVGRVIVEGNKHFSEANVRASVPALTPGQAPSINQIARNLRVANESHSSGRRMNSSVGITLSCMRRANIMMCMPIRPMSW